MSPSSFYLHRTSSRAFSLLEVLAVLVIISILAVISIPLLGSVANSYRLNSAAQSVLGQLNNSRQDALADNRPVQVRFYKISDGQGDTGYQAMQSFRENMDSSGTVTLVAVTKLYFFPEGICILSDSTASTLFSTTVSGAGISSGDSIHPLPAPYGSSPYIYFRFRSNGRTDLLVSSLLTLAVKKAPIQKNNLPANFITLQIDPVNGNVRSFQP